jgi:chorismate dehydratase
LTKLIFREFLGFEPTWSDAAPDVDAMLADSDAALLIGDPALRMSSSAGPERRVYDLAELWHDHTGFGFVFAMWMSRRASIPIDLAAARDEGVSRIDEIAANYASDTGLSRDEMKQYLTKNISYSIDDSMLAGLELYFSLAAKHGLIAENRALKFV